MRRKKFVGRLKGINPLAHILHRGSAPLAHVTGLTGVLKEEKPSLWGGKEVQGEGTICMWGTKFCPAKTIEEKDGRGKKRIV